MKKKIWGSLVVLLIVLAGLLAHHGSGVFFSAGLTGSYSETLDPAPVHAGGDHSLAHQAPDAIGPVPLDEALEPLSPNSRHQLIAEANRILGVAPLPWATAPQSGPPGKPAAVRNHESPRIPGSRQFVGTINIDGLKKKIQTASTPRIRERDLLLLAGKYAGVRDWQAAGTIYEELLGTTTDPSVSQACRRNLDIVSKNLAVERAAIPGEKARLKLELALLHRALGHEGTARRMLRSLAKTSEAKVRLQAESALAEMTASASVPQMGKK